MLQDALVLVRESVGQPTQRSYNSTWTKWVVFMQMCHHNPTADYIGCAQIDHDQLLQLLLMFVSYVVDIIQKAPTSIPTILSALRYQLTIRCVVRSPRPLTMIYWLQPRRASPVDPMNQNCGCLARMG